MLLKLIPIAFAVVFGSIVLALGILTRPLPADAAPADPEVSHHGWHYTCVMLNRYGSTPRCFWYQYRA